MKKKITIGDLEFDPFISEKEIKAKVNQLASQIKTDYKGKNPIFVVVMNGAFVFAADLLRKINLNCDIKFVQVKSYIGLDSSGEVEIVWPPETDFKNRHIIIIEDIVDTGITLARLLPKIADYKPSSIEITSIFVKPEALHHNVEIKYAGISIPKAFIVGYGLDYSGLGRNLKDVYQLKDAK